ncbi:MAG: SDR family oxidoreductase [Planctomycetia bacterium]|nr:SDR family oxidoreductase [Planctomycetia bacterium]
MIDLSGNVALVTGGSRGLGREIALQLARAGCDLAFTYRSDAAAAGVVRAAICALGRKAVDLQADVADYERAHAVVRETEEQLGPLSILVCNAGVARSASLLRMTEADWDDVLGISLKGSFNYLHAVAPGFVARKAGKIVCIGSINGLRGRIGTASYNAAKAGLTGLVKTAAAELGPYSVNVNLVAPGFIETTSQQNTSELIRDLVLKECAIKRLGQPEDIAPLVTFLCSPLARHLTGQVIKADAGQYL